MDTVRKILSRARAWLSGLNSVDSGRLSFFEFCRLTFSLDHFLRADNFGVILIEFAVSIPVLISGLYASCDVPKYFLWNFKVENASRYAANMIQHATNGAPLRSNDLVRVSHAAFLNIYVGDQSVSSNDDGSQMRHGHNSALYVYRVKGVAKDKGKVIWGWRSDKAKSSPSNRISTSGDAYIDSRVSIVKANKNSEISGAEIFKDLKIEKDETKMIIEAGIVQSEKYADGTLTSSNPRKMLGYMMMPVLGDKMYMGNALVITPEKGIFSDELPVTVAEAQNKEETANQKAVADLLEKIADLKDTAQNAKEQIAAIKTKSELDETKFISAEQYLSQIENCYEQAKAIKQEADQLVSGGNSTINSREEEIKKILEGSEADYAAIGASLHVVQEQTIIDYADSLLQSVLSAMNSAVSKKSLTEIAIKNNNLSLAQSYSDEAKASALDAETAMNALVNFVSSQTLLTSSETYKNNANNYFNSAKKAADDAEKEVADYKDQKKANAENAAKAAADTAENYRSQFDSLK
ncbi:MAG: hypothetical protein LBD81_00800, partial [Holosporaceae bacterium]|nr:hypothetical protein [Holosporaceae bacterium]